VDDLPAVLGALANIVLPMVKAGWLLGQASKLRSSRPDPHGNMRGGEDR
jgi:hypothetical protein